LAGAADGVVVRLVSLVSLLWPTHADIAPTIVSARSAETIRGMLAPP
jgi:hypothetical protein